MIVGSPIMARPDDRGDAPAVIATGAGLSRDEFRSIAEDMAARARWSCPDGGRGGVIGIVATPAPEMLAVFTGLAAAGWCVGVLDPGWTPSETAAALAQLDPSAILVDSASRVDGLLHEDVEAEDAGRGWTAFVRRGCRSAPHRPSADTPFYAGFTSGSGGRPKTFVRSHGSWWRSFDGFDAWVGADPAATAIIPGPLAGSHFLFGALHALHAGAPVVLTAPSRLEAAVAEHPGCAVYVVPAMLPALCAAPVSPAAVFCAGAALAPSLAERFRNAHPRARLVEYYGASELSFVTIRDHADDAPDGTAGQAFPGVEISVRDESGEDVPAGTVGTIFARSALVFDGYRGRPPESGARTIGDGWWTVGDRGALDRDGHLTVAGRGTSLIICGGVNIQPEEIEAALVDHPDVAACAVVGLPHPRWGEQVCAVIQAASGKAPDRGGLRTHLAARISSTKRPHRYVFTDEPLPRLNGGKPDRRAIRDRLLKA
ncbi:MAG: AMP-binding protein [Thermoleophilia bacterium]|nr:AMP-binding protein [Thermoleophilia bacterium]